MTDLHALRRVAYEVMRVEQAALFHERTRDRGRLDTAVEILAEVDALARLAADVPAPLRLLLGPALRRQAAGLVVRLGALVPAEALRRRLAEARR